MKRTRRAFTLVELIVAIGISSVIGIFVITLAAGVTDVWNDADNSATMAVEVQYAFDVIAKDFESAVFRNRGETMLAVDALSNGSTSGDWEAPVTERPSDPSPFDPAEDRYGWAGCWVRFFTASPTLNAVGYQIIRSPILTTSTDYRYNLFRGSVRVDHTADAGLNIKNDAYSSTGSQISENPGAVYSPQLENILLRNVVDFGVRMFVSDPSVSSPPPYAPQRMRLIFPADGSGNLDSSDDSHSAQMNGGANDDLLYPDAVEIVVRVLTPDGADLLADLEESGGDQSRWQAIVDEHSKVYRRFVSIGATSI